MAGLQGAAGFEASPDPAVVARAVALCREALEMIDQDSFPLEIGARLDHVLSSLLELEERGQMV